jgi:aspartyl-tRNA(Asn)/glutamyl-tRNA(Gln) amidotransferase subunit A
MTENLTLTDIIKGLQTKEFSSLEITRAYLERIKKYEPTFNSFISVCNESALAGAQQADAKRASGDSSPWLGVPLAHKDTFNTLGVRTSAASKILDNYIAPYNAHFVDKFAQAGVVMLGKTNMDEFAMGAASDTSYYGSVYNPWNSKCSAGGSSGGSAAAVAARLTPMATATDTGGSIRQPAAFCGLTGIKPTYGRVSRWGMISFAPSLDQAGVICQTAQDAAISLQMMAGFDEKDSTSVNCPVPDYSAQINADIKGKKIGVLSEYIENLNSSCQKLFADAIAVYKQLGAEIIEISLADIELALPTYYIIGPAEASSNLARYDGVRYGYRCNEPADLEDLYTRSRSEAFGAEVKRRMLIGAYVLSASSYDNYYLKAQKVRQLIKQSFSKAFAKVDAILAPTSPHTAFEFAKRPVDNVSMYLEDIFTVTSNLACIPAMSLPIGLSNNLPVGMQLIGSSFSEGTLLNLAHQYQTQTSWHQQLPHEIQE